MNNLIPYDTMKSMQVRTEKDLPPHITFEQWKSIYDNLTGLDQLLWGFLWETGGRISAVLSIKWNDIDLMNKELKLLVQKKKVHTTLQVPLSNAMISDIRNYQVAYKPQSNAYVFDTERYKREKSSVGRLTRQGAWAKVQKWGKQYLNLDKIHPHMLRHGLAIYLLANNVPLVNISRRLGHSNVFITANIYLVITPELDRMMTAHVPMR